MCITCTSAAGPRSPACLIRKIGHLLIRFGFVHTLIASALRTSREATKNFWQKSCRPMWFNWFQLLACNRFSHCRMQTLKTCNWMTLISMLLRCSVIAAGRQWFLSNAEDGVSPIAEDYADVSVVFTDPWKQISWTDTGPNSPTPLMPHGGLHALPMRPIKQYFLVIPHDQDISCRRDLLFCGLPRICRASQLLAPAPRPRVQGFKLKIDCCIPRCQRSAQAVAKLVKNHSLIRNSGQTLHVEQSWFNRPQESHGHNGGMVFLFTHILIIWNLICVYHSINAVI